MIIPKERRTLHKKFETPVIEIEKFQIEDVITTSGGCPKPELNITDELN